MARWKLMTGHYLNCGTTEWEYMELDQSTGEQVRKRFKVPRLLDPLDPKCWNYSWGPKDRVTGEIIVALEGKGQPKDYIIDCEPTPDMTPLDDEAKTISASLEKKWSYKPDSEGGSFADTMINQFHDKMADLQTKPVEIPGLSDLVKALTASVAQNQQLIESLIAQRPATPAPAPATRRI